LFSSLNRIKIIILCISTANADILLIESFIGTHSGDNKKIPLTYSRRDEATDIKRINTLKQLGYKTIALSYGPSEDITFANHCKDKAKEADYFIYTQPPGWEHPGFKLFSF